MAPISLPRLRGMVRKELRQLLRDPRSKRMMFASPLVQLVLFAYAVNTDVRHAGTFVVDHDRTAVSRQLVATFTASGYFDVVGHGERPAQMAAALDRGEALVGLEIPRGFAADVMAGRAPQVQVLVDGTTSNTATVAMGYAQQIVGTFGRSGDGAIGIELRSRVWYNPNLVSRVYNVPGVIGTIVMLMGLLLTALAVVREREIGTLEQLMVSPISSLELMLGKTIPVVLICFIDLVLIATVALLWFDIPFRGSWLLLLLASVCYILTALGLGLFISTVSATQQEAFMSMFFFFLPAIMLSGFMYPVANMPDVVQVITWANPIRHYLDVVRGIFLKGAGFQALWLQIAILAGMGIVVLTLAAGRFRKTME